MTDWRAAARTCAPLAPVGSDAAACCVYAEALIRAVYGEAAVGRAPEALWRLFGDCRDGWGPISAVVRAGLSTSPVLSAVPSDGRWYRVQAWHDPADADRVTAGHAPVASGHTFTCWRDPHGGPGRLIDSSIAHGPRDTLVYANGWPGWFGQFGALRCVAMLEAA